MQNQMIAITATFTAEPVKESIAFWMRELNFPYVIEFAPYNQVFQQLLDPSSLLSKNQNGINVILVRFEDLKSDQKDGIRGIEQNVLDLLRVLKTASERSSTPQLVCLCPASSDAPPVFNQMEEMMMSELDQVSGAYLITTSDIFSTYPVSGYYDPHGDKLGHIPFTMPFYTALGTIITRKINAIKSVPYKVIVLDCDQTLWKGVCGEENPLSLEIDPPRKKLQEFMVTQHDAGMLLCLCSKNNEEDVLEVFKRRLEMPLRLDHIVSWKINWRSKAENIRSLAHELKLGLDSFVFIDDDPVECAEVQAACPEVLTLQLPQEADSIPEFLRNVWAFDRLKVTQEDKKRTELYRQDIQRESLRSGSISLEDFLKSLRMKIRISEMAQHHLTRAAQLTQRTNQFNFTTIRRSESEIQESGSECLVVEVSDRFGDYGLVGLIMFRTGHDSVDVDTFLLSCRALGRGVEHRMMARLGEIAQNRGISNVNVTYIPSGKNTPALNFLDSIGAEFKQIDGDNLQFKFPARFAASLVYKPGLSGEYSSPVIADPPVATMTAPKSPLMNRIANELCDPEKIFKAVEYQRRRVRPDLNVDYIAPRTPVEETLTGIWTQVMGVEKIGVCDNFFELGGHSTMIIQIISQVRDAFRVDLTFRNFFEMPTVAGLAAIITKILADQTDVESIDKIIEKIQQLPEDELDRILNVELWESSIKNPRIREGLNIEALIDASGKAENINGNRPFERYRCADIERFPFGDELELVYSRSSSASRILPLCDVNLLSRCGKFRTLDEHAVQICRELGLNEDHVRSINIKLAELAHAGFLISQSNIFEKFKRPTDNPAKITTVGLVTCERLGALKRALMSYIENSKQYGRMTDFVVVDDSRGAETRDSYRQMLRTLKSDGVRIFYAGLEEKASFAKQMIESADLPVDIVNFMLFNSEGLGYTCGANENALMLHTAGQMILKADDDTICRVAAAPEQTQGLMFTSGVDPNEVWFFPDRETALESVNFAENNILTSHEQFLGRDLANIISSIDEARFLNMDAVGNSFLRRLEAGDGKVLVTFNGLVGDCAWGAPFGYWNGPMGCLLLDDRSHERIIQSESVYRSACTSREILRFVRCPTISDEKFSMFGFVGLDNRDLLLPFMPVQRGQDIIFDIILWRCFENSYFCHIPWVLLHAPVDRRIFQADGIFSTASGLDTARLTIDCIKSFNSWHSKVDGRDRLRALGAYLMELGSMPLRDFEEFVRITCWQSNSSLACLLEESLKARNGLPEFWANDVRKYLDILRQSVIIEDYFIPLDLIYGRSIDEARGLAQRLVKKYGQLLYWWPDIVNSVKNLQNRDIKLAQPV